MTTKAQAVLQRMKRRDEERAWRLFRDPVRSDRILREFNQSTLDDVGPIGSQDQQMRVLSEMNDLGEQKEQIIRGSFPKVTV